jgi:hypothetical protein
MFTQRNLAPYSNQTLVLFYFVKKILGSGERYLAMGKQEESCGPLN